MWGWASEFILEVILEKKILLTYQSSDITTHDMVYACLMVRRLNILGMCNLCLGDTEVELLSQHSQAWGWELKFSLGFRPSALIDCSGRSSSRPICPVLSPLSLSLNKFRGSYPQVVLALQPSYMSSQTISYLQWDEILTPLKILFLNPTRFLIFTVLIFPDSHHWYKSPNLSSTHPWIIYYSWFYYFKKAPIKMIPADSFFWHNIIYRQ